MGLFGIFAGLFAASKVHDNLSDGNEGLGGDLFDMGISMGVGGVVKDVVDEILEQDEDEDEFDY